MQCFVAAVFLLFGCFLGTHCNMMSTQFRDFIMNKYNQYRNMQEESNNWKLVWSENLAQESENWLSNCRFEHQKSPNNFYGENIAFYTGSDVTENMEQAFQDWYQYYSYFRENGAISSRSNQMNWYQAREVGCAYRRCPSLFSNGRYVQNAWYFVCRYNPGGYVKSQYGYSQGSGFLNTESETFSSQENGWNQDMSGYNQETGRFDQGMDGYEQDFGFAQGMGNYGQNMGGYNNMGAYNQGNNKFNQDFDNNQQDEGSYNQNTEENNENEAEINGENGENPQQEEEQNNEENEETVSEEVGNESEANNEQNVENNQQSGSGPAGCMDMKPQCSSWANDGQCESNSGFMSFYCKQSCNYCQNPGQNRPNGGCMDQFMSCKRFAFNCQTSEMMKTYCPVTCGFC